MFISNQISNIKLTLITLITLNNPNNPVITIFFLKKKKNPFKNPIKITPKKPYNKKPKKNIFFLKKKKPPCNNPVKITL